MFRASEGRCGGHGGPGAFSISISDPGRQSTHCPSQPDSINRCVYIYIYIYREREREYIYIYILHICIYIYMYYKHVELSGGVFLLQEPSQRARSIDTSVEICIHMYIIYIYIYIYIDIYIYTHLYIYIYGCWPIPPCFVLILSMLLLVFIVFWHRFETLLWAFDTGHEQTHFKFVCVWCSVLCCVQAKA